MAAAFAAGALASLAFAPLFVFPLLLLGYGVLVLLLDGAAQGPRAVRAAAWAGWAFGFGHFLVGLHWIGYAFMVDPDAHAWQLPFVALLFPGGLALFPAAAAALAARFWPHGAARIFLFAALFGLAEWLRGHVLTGFPWNLPAYGWGASLELLQSTAFIGAYGLSMLTLLFGGSLACLARDTAGMRRWWLPAACAGAFLLIGAGGALRLSAADDSEVPGVRLRLVQPGVPQDEKYRPELRERNWRRLVDLSRMNAGEEPTHIIWPEAAPPFLLAREPRAMADIAALTRPSRILMTGAVRITRDGGDVRVMNGFYVFGSGARLLASYDKAHLVPFGEYLPFQSLLDAVGITKIVGGPGGFTPGPGRATLDVPGAPPMGPLICYEAIFPADVTAQPRPQWLLNVTDDSWFGPWAGPAQHLLTARVRAIEEGLPIIRVANTGISAVIDGNGRLRVKLELGAVGALDAKLPVALKMTAFAVYHTVVFIGLLVFCLSAAVWLARPRRSSLTRLSS